jgi:hypothetical protein
MHGKREKPSVHPADSTKRTNFTQQPWNREVGKNFTRKPDMVMVWYINSDGNFSSAPVRTGSTDGKVSEIVWSRNIKEGTKVITELLERANSNTKSEKQTQNRRMGPPPLFH